MKNVNYLLNSFWSIYIVERQFPKHLHSSRIVLTVELLLKLMIAKWFLVWLFVIILAVVWLLALVHKHLIQALSWSNEESDCSIPISLPDKPDRWCSTKVPYHHHRDFDNNYGLWWILQKNYFKKCGWTIANRSCGVWSLKFPIWLVKIPIPSLTSTTWYSFGYNSIVCFAFPFDTWIFTLLNCMTE